MSFLIKDNELLVFYNEICDNVRKVIKKDLIVRLYTTENI